MEPFPMLLGPFLYFYARSFRETITWRKAFPHLAGFAIYFIVAWWYHSYLREKYPGLAEATGDMMKNTPGYIFSFLKIGWFVFYYFITRNSLNLYQRSIQHLFSDTSRIDLNWAKWLNNGNILLILISIVITGIIYFNPEQFNLLMLVNIAIFTPFLYIVTYKGIMQSTLWRHTGMSKKNIENEMQMQEVELKRLDNKAIKQQKIKPDLDKMTSIINQLRSLMEEEKLFQEPELTLQNLADRLQIPPYLVSQAINDGMNKNFYDLINNYRVKEAKRLLTDPKNNNYTILSVGFEAGFNSKTTFNTVFKKFTGFTPTEFREKEKQVITAA